MRILIVSQFYPPETGAPQNRLSFLARWLANAGHTITVVTALPSYPLGAIFEPYRGRLVADEREDGIRVIRTWLYATKSKGFLRRMLNYCSFSLLSIVAGTLLAGPQECVIVESPPLPLGLSGFIISRIKRAKFIFNVSDLWPESAVALGVLRRRSLIQIATRLEEFLYRKADVITGQTEGIVSNIRSRCTGKPKPIVLISNGVDTEAFAACKQRQENQLKIREHLGLSGQFVVGYAGLMGLAQGLETVIESARTLSCFQNISFLFVGDGPEKLHLMKSVTEAGLRNVLFVPAQPASRMPEILSAFDVALVPLKRHVLFKGALPSKMFEAMGAGVPVICSVDGEARRVVEESEGGIYVEPERADQLADAVLHVYRTPDLKEVLGENGRRYVETKFNRADSAKKFESILARTFSMIPEPSTMGPPTSVSVDVKNG